MREITSRYLRYSLVGMGERATVTPLEGVDRMKGVGLGPKYHRHILRGLMGVFSLASGNIS